MTYVMMILLFNAGVFLGFLLHALLHNAHEQGWQVQSKPNLELLDIEYDRPLTQPQRGQYLH